MSENLKKILKIEGGKVSDAALSLIAKASEGSVRDSLSLLDRALVGKLSNQEEVDEKFVRKMLGIADRSKTLELLNLVFAGEQKQSIQKLREMINDGIDPVSFLNDFLEILHFVMQKKNIGNLDSDLSISESELEAINLISKDVSSTTIIIFWQFILKGLDELSIVTNQILSLEMLLIRLIHLKDMPSYDAVLDSINNNSSNPIEEKINHVDSPKTNVNEKNKISKNQIKNTIQIKPELRSLEPKNLIKESSLEILSTFEDLIKLASKKKEVELKYDLERNVNLIKFVEGKIDISFNENLAKNFVRNLSEKLLEWTGKRWVITLTKGAGDKTFLETKSINESKLLEEEKSGEIYKKFKKTFC